MLQPMQPMGQQPKPGMNMPQAPQGQRPQAPGQQMMPAGAAMQQGILPGGIASNPEDIKAAYGGTPQGQQKLKQAAGNGDYLSAIALAQILEEEREKAAAKAAQMSQGGKPPPVMDRMREEAVDLRRQDLEQQQAKRLGAEQQRSQGAMAQMVQQAARPPMQGIAQLPAPNVAQPQAMAAGGIIAFNGEDVSAVPKPTEEEVRPVGANPYAGLSNKQIIEKYGREQLGANRQEAERRARDEYMKFVGHTPEEKARQEKRIADMEAYDKQAYDPEEMRSQRLIRSLSAARGLTGAEALGNYGLASSLYYDKQRELVRQRMADRQKQSEAWDEAQRGVRLKGFEAGEKEGKEVLLGQRQGIAGLGEVVQADASMANAALRASGGAGAGNKALEDASQAIARDVEIGDLKNKLKDQIQGTKEYNDLLNRIRQKENAYYKWFKVPVPDFPELQAQPEKPKEEPWYKRFFGENKEARANLGLGSTPQAQGNLPPGIPPGSVKIGASNGNPVYETPDGKRLVVKP